MIRAALVRLMTLAIRGYRYVLSPAMGPGKCRFYPTCSEYAAEAITRHGPVKGLWLSLIRVLNCHSFSRRPFHDPVPEAIKPSIQGSPDTKTRE